ncbi:hypothetical protein [Candidatus Clostridium radicumherbarum]|uniref:DUF4129 domain-containing protein n=1 Tax=Candidatus Clostridium radicumherbarum TaxID=3381662 RepID=A0ABW8TWQ1_9CLOT
MKLISLVMPSKSEFEKGVYNIVQSPSYSHLRNGASDFINNVKEGLTKWLTEFLNKIFINVDKASVYSEELSTVFIIFGILIIAAIIIVIILKINKTSERKRKVKEILGEKINENTTPNSLREKALNYYENGDVRQALRYDFMSLLLLMHNNKIIYLDETKTNEEIYSFLRKNNFNMLKNFKVLIDSFNLSWYGNKEIQVESYRVWNSNINLIWNEVVKHES